MALVCDESHYTLVQYVALGILLILEYWLGKTPKMKASSTVELLIRGLKFIIFRKGK